MMMNNIAIIEIEQILETVCMVQLNDDKTPEDINYITDDYDHIRIHFKDNSTQTIHGNFRKDMEDGGLGIRFRVTDPDECETYYDSWK